MANNSPHCTHLDDLVVKEEVIIERHIDDHKYFQHIEDRNQAIINFVNKFGWAIREGYCESCPDNPTCESYANYLKCKDWKVYENAS